MKVKIPVFLVFLVAIGAFLAINLSAVIAEAAESAGTGSDIQATKSISKESEEDNFSTPPGTAEITTERQQLIGVRVETVEKNAIAHTVRLLGRVAPDENRTFRITASSELWVRKVYPPTTGAVVKKDEPLIAFYTTNFFSAAASYMYALNTLDRTRQSKTDTPAQMGSIDNQVRQAVEALQNLGVSDVQIRRMARTRKIEELVDVVSPAAGFILSRNATLNQWVPSGTELYAVADLSRVWVLADIFEREAGYFSPEVAATVILPYQRKTFTAQVSKVLPIFDPSTRTLKVRLEAENPDFVLRPDMFVDVELPVSLPAAVFVSADAVLDSGLRKTVFVDRGDGYFEPREVETGLRMGNRVEIVRGLEAGERIVTSGTFLIDSESKLQLAAQGMHTTLSKDPVCGAEVSQVKAEKAGRKIVYRGKTYYFESDECMQKFERETERWIKE
jgi:RND family efflux transporter MFP subunit